VALLAPRPELERQVRDVMPAGDQGTFSLGHGVLPETPVEALQAVVEWVHGGEPVGVLMAYEGRGASTRFEPYLQDGAWGAAHGARVRARIRHATHGSAAGRRSGSSPRGRRPACGAHWNNRFAVYVGYGHWILHPDVVEQS